MKMIAQTKYYSVLLCLVYMPLLIAAQDHPTQLVDKEDCTLAKHEKVERIIQRLEEVVAQHGTQSDRAAVRLQTIVGHITSSGSKDNQYIIIAQ